MRFLNLKMLLVGTFVLCQTSLKANDYDSLYHQALSTQYSQIDLSIQNFNKCLSYYEENGDLDKIIDVKLKLVKLHSGSGNYQNAYDEAWSLLPDLDNLKHQEERIELLQQLSSLYIIFDQYQDAHFYLNQAKSAIQEIKNANKQSLLLSKLYGIEAWLITNETSDFNASKELLLKALDENKKLRNVSDVYLRMQLANLFLINDSLNQAEDMLTELEDQTSQKHLSAHSLLFDHIGQLHMKRNRFNVAITYFKRCIDALDRYKNHQDNKVEVLDSLASCYYYLGVYDSAFYYSRLSDEINDVLFGSKSSVNKKLFEIKNTYEEQLNNQRLELLENENKVLVLKSITFVSILMLIIIILVVVSHLRVRKLKEMQRFEKEQQRCELEIKNKELTTAALKLIERDTLLNDIRSGLNKMKFNEVNQDVVNKMISSISANKAKKWDEFELYFNTVNQDFYQILKARFSELSATDLKMCALIKLGLSSKDMADIMAIGADSINTSRSRIRKKMNLTRDVNLVEFLNDLV